MHRFLELHKSLDGILEFGVTIADDGDLTIGFVADSSRGTFYGHTHGDILERLLELPVEQAIATYVQSILAGKKIIAVIRIDGNITDVFVLNEPESAVDWLEENEELELRFWNG